MVVRLWKYTSSHTLLVGMQKGWGWPWVCLTATHLQATLALLLDSPGSVHCFHLGYFNGFSPSSFFFITAHSDHCWRLKYLKCHFEIYNLFFHYFPDKVPIIWHAIQGPSLASLNLPFISPFMLPSVWTKSLLKLPFLTSESCSCCVLLLESCFLITA